MPGPRQALLSHRQPTGAPAPARGDSPCVVSLGPFSWKPWPFTPPCISVLRGLGYTVVRTVTMCPQSLHSGAGPDQVPCRYVEPLVFPAQLEVTHVSPKRRAGPGRARRLLCELRAWLVQGGRERTQAIAESPAWARGTCRGAR